MTDPRISVLASLADRYEIAGEIGRGGMATVYRARDKRHASDVAIKVLRPELALALGGERFTREVRVTAALQHPNILPLLDSGEAEGLPYYVMPFVSGASLEQRLLQHGPLPIGDAIQYTAEIADGLAYAHAQGFIHRDIKPANILLSQGHALLADFGIARVLDVGADKLTDTGLAVGTAAYMSPEQAAGEHVDGRSDIYALGCVLYELLTGSAPFSGASQRAIMARHAVDPVPSVRTVRGEVPPAIEVILARALAKMPADRFADATEFRNALLLSTTAAASYHQSSSRAFPAARWTIAGAVALAAVGIAWVTVARRASGGTLDSRRVMVFPLVLAQSWTGSLSAGEDASAMIGSMMDGAGAIRWVDGWQQLPPAQRNNMRSLVDADYDALARKNHARYVVTGRMSTTGDSASVGLQLRDLETGAPLAQPNKLARSSEWWRAASSAVADLLPRIIPGASSSVQKEWSDRNPKAIALFLAAEAAFRHLQRDSALTLFKAAVNADSAFGFAALRGAQAASWAHQFNDAKLLVRVALAHAKTPRDQAFAGGLDAFLEGRADSSVAALRAALAIDADMSVAWMQLSETYLHLLPSEGITDSLADDALAHAVALDSSSTGLIFHQVELAARGGNRARVDWLASRFLATASDTMLRGEVALIKACVDGAWSDSLLHDAAVHRPQPLSIAAKLIGLSHPKCMRDGYAKLLQVDTSNTALADGRRFFAVVGLHQALLAKGATDSAMKEVDRFISRWKYGTSIFLMDAPVVPAFAARARAIAADDSARLGANFQGVPYSSRLWLLGTWALFDGRLPTAQTVAADLAKRATHDGHQTDSVRSGALQAHIAVAARDTSGAIRQLQALLKRAALKDSVSWEETASLGLERLTLGRLLMARREFAGAREVLRVLDSAAPASFPLYAPLALQLRIDVAKALGDAAEEEALRKRLKLMGS